MPEKQKTKIRLPLDISIRDLCQYQHNKLRRINGSLSSLARLLINKKRKTFSEWNCLTRQTHIPALSGRGTPPTKTVFRGSNGMEASNTKSASERRHGLIWTGLSLMVGDDTHKYNLSSSVMQASISDWTLLSSCKEKQTKKNAKMSSHVTQ